MVYMLCSIPNSSGYFRSALILWLIVTRTIVSDMLRIIVSDMLRAIVSDMIRAIVTRYGYTLWLHAIVTRYSFTYDTRYSYTLWFYKAYAC